MLQSYEIEQRFTAIEYAIGLASQACSADRDVPSELRIYIQKLDKQSDQAKLAIQAQDEPRIRKAVVELELLGARARLVCGSGARVTPHMNSAVTHLHEALSHLKQQLP